MQIIEKALRGYRLRWKIEEFHRHVKQEFHWEEMQLMSYIGLNPNNAVGFYYPDFKATLLKLLCFLI